MKGRKQVFLVLAGVLGISAAIALSACGGDDSPEQPITFQTETAEALSKADYIDEADSRCAEANAAIAVMVENGEGFTGAAEIADLRQTVLQELKELGPPSEDRASLDQFLTALEQQVEAGQKIGLAIDRDEDTTQFETDLADAQADAQAAAEEYGFKDCGSEVTATDTSGDTGTGDTGAAPVTPAPAPAPVTPAPDTGGTGDTGGDTGGGGGIGIP